MPRPATATGSNDIEKRRNDIFERLPMIMFCGLPTSVATLPRLALMASAKRYGGSGSRPRIITVTTSGVSMRHTVSLTSSADNPPEVSIR